MDIVTHLVVAGLAILWLGWALGWIEGRRWPSFVPPLYEPPPLADPEWADVYIVTERDMIDTAIKEK